MYVMKWNKIAQRQGKQPLEGSGKQRMPRSPRERKGFTELGPQIEEAML